MLRAVQFFCCSGPPKSTSSDYYFDPRVATMGSRQFNTEKTQCLISDFEFEEMRKEMIIAGGNNLKTAQNLYILMLTLMTICFAWWAVRFTLNFTGIHRFSVPTIVISIVLTVFTNVSMNVIWKVYMKKAAKDVQEMFDQKNKEVYSGRGIYWETHQTLSYIHIRIVASEVGGAQEIPLGHHAEYKQPAQFVI